MAPFDPIDAPVTAAGRGAAGVAGAVRRRGPRVLFEEDFSPARPPARVPAAPTSEPEPAEPSYSAADLEDARRSAFRDGREAGRTAARAEAEAAGEAALASIAANLQQAAAEAKRAAEQAGEATVGLLLGMLAALHPSLAPQLAAADTEAMLAALLPQLIAEPRLALRVCPPLVAKLEPRLGAIAEAAGFAGSITLKPDPAVAPDGATLSWSAGAAMRDPGALRTTLLDALRPLGLAPLMPESDHAQ